VTKKEALQNVTKMLNKSMHKKEITLLLETLDAKGIIKLKKHVLKKLKGETK